MKWITTTDIVQWAPKRNCQETLPQLIRKLIRATSGSVNKIHFPTGDNVLIGGWDGILETAKGTDFIPEGISVWEFGTSKDCKGKADDDYNKRSANPIGVNPAETTFVFVTPRNWTKGDEWITEKKKDGNWKEIQVINAAVLEEWLETAPTVSEWLASVHLRKPSREVQSTDAFWDRWSTGPQISLSPSLLLGGREDVSAALYQILDSSSLTAIKSSSIEESLAFIISSFKNNPTLEEDFFSRSLIVEQPIVFRELIALQEPLILIPIFEDEGSFQYAVRNGHNLIVPLGADSANMSDQIILGPINRDKFVEDLMRSGLSREKANKLSKESARNVTVLRRQLEFVNNLPEWAKTEYVREIIPALLVGRWNEDFSGDKAIIAELAGESYEEYQKKITKWLNKSDSPFIKIGNNWRLISPLDAWIKAMPNITENDFRLLGENFLKVLNELNPAFELQPEQRLMAQAHGKKREYSEWLREGLCQSVILTSIYGSQLSQTIPYSSSIWAEGLIRKLLDTADPLTWKSLASKFPLLAEAAPVEFMSLVEKYLKQNPSPIIQLFEEEPGLITPNTFYIGMLYALEGLAWEPQFLTRSSLILAELDTIDPGGTFVNRPSNSLYEIFVPWHYQTKANYNERMAVLNLIAKKQPRTAWKLFKSLLPISGRGIAMSTHKMRWRFFNEEIEDGVPLIEMHNSHSTIISLMLTVFDYSEDELSDLIRISTHRNLNDRNIILQFIENEITKMPHPENTAWHTLRNILHMHRTMPDKSSLPEEILQRYAKLYEQLEPSDEFQKIGWIFEEHWPEFPDGSDYKLDFHKRTEQLSNRRNTILKELYEQHGAQKIYSFAESLKETWVLGDSFGRLISDEDLFNLLVKELPTDELSRFVQGLLIRRSINFDFESTVALYQRLKESELSEVALARFLAPSAQSMALWKFIDSTSTKTKEQYWKEMNPHFWHLGKDEKIEGIRRLTEIGRYFSAIHAIEMDTEIDYPTDLIVSLLIKAATETATENGNFRQYEVKRIIESLSERDDVEQKTLLLIEWYYLGLLIDVSRNGAPKILSEAMSSDPEFFVEIIKWAYRPDDEKLLEEELKDVDDETIAMRGRQAWDLLHSWNKIPGMDENGVLNGESLKQWVSEVRNLAMNCGRSSIIDFPIARILAHIPYAEDNWPPISVCEIFEEVNTESLTEGYNSELFNIHGFSSRGVFDGGTVERDKSNHYKTLADKFRNQFPVITKVFEDLANGYEQDAIRWDQKAQKDILDN